jgi:hypothetical protein
VADAFQDGNALRIGIEVAAEFPLDFLGIFGTNLGVEVDGRISGREARFAYEERDIDTDQGVRIEGLGSADDSGSASGSYSARGVGGALLPDDAGTWSGGMVTGLQRSWSVDFTVPNRIDSVTFDGTRIWAALELEDDGGSLCTALCPLDAQGSPGACILDGCNQLPDTYPWCRSAVVFASDRFWCFDDQGWIHEVTPAGQVVGKVEAPSGLRGSLAITFDGQEFVSATAFQVCRFDPGFAPLGCVPTPFFSVDGIAVDLGEPWLLVGFPHKLVHLDQAGAVLGAAALPAEIGWSLDPNAQVPPQEKRFTTDMILHTGGLVIPAALFPPGESTTFYRMELP